MHGRCTDSSFQQPSPSLPSCMVAEVDIEHEQRGDFLRAWNTKLFLCFTACSRAPSALKTLSSSPIGRHLSLLCFHKTLCYLWSSHAFVPRLLENPRAGLWQRSPCSPRHSGFLEQWSANLHSQWGYEELSLESEKEVLELHLCLVLIQR